MMSEAVIIMMNMRGGCATVGNTVHALFRVNDRRRRTHDSNDRIGNVGESTPGSVGNAGYDVTASDVAG